MAQQKRQVELNNFSGGFNTEQSPLNADPSTTIQEQNMVLASDGSRAPRYGLTTEEYTDTSSAVTTSLWPVDPPVGSIKTCYVDGSIRDFTYFNKSDTSIILFENSDGYVLEDSSKIVMDVLVNGDSTKNHFSRGSQLGSGAVIPAGTAVIGLYPDNYDSSLETPEENVAQYSYIAVRDIWGIDDTLGITDRPTDLTIQHAYNLFNQGWTADSVVSFYNDMGVFPSNGDVPYYGLIADFEWTDEDGDGYEDDAYTVTYKYDSDLLETPPFTSGAPKGRNIVSAHTPRYTTDLQYAYSSFAEFRYCRSLFEEFLRGVNLYLFLDPALDIEDIDDNYEDTNWKVDCTTSFAGRIFYTGSIVGDDVNSDSYSEDGFMMPSFRNAVLFSKSVTSPNLMDYAERSRKRGLTVLSSTPGSPDDFFIESDTADAYVNACFSVDDPTDETFTPTASDGGIFFVTDANRILCTASLSDSLLIIATNGVWELRTQDGMSPSGFSVTKVVDVTIQSAKSVVTTPTAVMVPTETGIMAFYYDSDSRRTAYKNTSDDTIRRWYNKYYDWFSWGIYDSANSCVKWLLRTPIDSYDDGDVVTIEQMELVVDMRLGAFSVNVFASGSGEINSADEGNFIKADSANTYNILGNYIKLPKSYSLGDEETPIDAKRNRISHKYLGVDDNSNHYSVIQYEKGNFSTDLGEDMPVPYMVTSPMTMGDTIRRKDVPYLWTHFYRSEDGFVETETGDWEPTNPSSCLLSARWDFSDNANSGKWSEDVQVYKLLRDYMPEDIDDSFDYGYNIITTKNNLRGSGKAISLKFTAETGYDMQLIGWGAEVAVGGSV